MPAQESGGMAGVVPFYLQVADELEAAIGELRAGEPMPSEHELARDHEINRLTARAALEELERRHLVRRQQGRRTVVARRVEFRLDQKGFCRALPKSVVKCGGVPRTEIASIRSRQPPPEIRRALKLDAKATATAVERRRFVDDELAAFTVTWLNSGYVPQLDKRLRGGEPLRVLLRECVRDVRRTAVRCRLRVAPADLAERLESPHRPLVFELAENFVAGKRRIGLTTTWLRADIFDVIFELKDGGKV